MFKRGSAAAFTISVALAAVHFGSPSAAAPSGLVPGEAHAFVGGGKAKPLYSGGCSAYIQEAEKPRAASKYKGPEDENKGSATHVIDSFFSRSGDGNPFLPTSVRYAIALAPDPRHTNLSLIFDREMALLVQAAQDEGYDYNSSWLPWKSEPSSPLAYLGERQYEDNLGSQRESCPGVVLFRRRNRPIVDSYNNGLVVFVVGEQATGGINQGQWFNTLVWLDSHVARNTLSKFKGKQQPEPPAGDGILRILGPTFTGSLPSLNRDLKALYAPAEFQEGDAPLPPADLRTKFPSARVLSGSVTSCSGVRWFERELPRSVSTSPSTSAPWHIDFGTFQENDAVQIYRLMKLLSFQGTPPSDTAILSEDESAYGAQEQLDSPCNFGYAQDNRPIHLVFPRDISALRIAYERQAIFDGSSTGLKEHAHPILRGEAPGEIGLSEITDTIASSNGSVAAIDQEANLYGLVSILRAHHSRYLVLRCTNPLDVLFLTRFFHRAYPQARIVTLGSDLFFRREIDTTEFRGVLSVSSYPLMPRAQHWSQITEDKWDEQNHNHLVFPAHLAEGMYLAARYTLQGEFLPDPNFSPEQAPASKIPLIPASQPGPAMDAKAGIYPPLRMYRAFPAPDYSDPFWFHPGSPDGKDLATHPPTWISAVGRDGYWPIAVVKDGQMNEICLQNENNRKCPASPADKSGTVPASTILELIEPDPATLAAPVTKETPESAVAQHYETSRPQEPGAVRSFHKGLKLKVPLPWVMTVLLASALLFYQIWGLKKGNINPSDGLFSIFRLSEDPAHSVLLALGCSLALTLLVELGGISLIPQNFLAISGSTPYFVILLFVILLAAGLSVLYMVRRKEKLDQLHLESSPKHHVLTLATFFMTLGFCILIYMVCFGCRLDAANSVPRFYRMMHITSGVSPLLPILLLTFGFYLWNWQTVAGGLIVAKGCPTLPRLSGEDEIAGGWFRVLSWGDTCAPQLAAGMGENTLQEENTLISHKMGRRILRVAHPFCFKTRIVAVPALMFCAAVICFEGIHSLPLLGLESDCFNVVIDGVLLLALLFSATEALRLYTTWIMLRKLLLALGRLRLRRTMYRLRPIDADSIWSVSGSVRRVQYSLFHDELEAAGRLIRLTTAAPLGNGPLPFLQKAQFYAKEFAKTIESENSAKTGWSSPIAPFDPAAPAPLPPLGGGPTPPEVRLPAHLLRDLLADAVGEVCNRLLVVWSDETKSMNLGGVGAKGGDDPKQIPLSDNAKVRAAEEFVAFHYIAFIQNIIARMRTMTLSMIFLFITVCAAISFYPFVPRTEVSVWLAINLLLIGGAVAYVYAGMERDEILSYIANSEPGRLGTDFYLRLAGFLAGPLLGILTTQFPSITDTALQWLQPGLDAIK